MTKVDHNTAAELLPWYANGTLAEDRHAAVEQHLRQCLPCRSAYKHELRVQRLLKEQPDVPLGPEHGLSDLLRQVDAGAAGRRSFTRMLPAFGYGLAAAVSLAIVWSMLLSPRPIDTPDAASFSTLTAGSAVTADRIDVVFAADVAEAEVHEIVTGLGAEIVDGPSALGRYTIRVPAGEASDLAAWLARLSADPRVRFAGQSFIDPSMPAGGDR